MNHRYLLTALAGAALLTGCSSQSLTTTSTETRALAEAAASPTHAGVTLDETPASYAQVYDEVALAPSPAASPSPARPGASPASRVSALPPTDAAFAQKAAEGGMMEVSLGRLAEQKAKTAPVKKSASRWSRTTPRPTRNCWRWPRAKGSACPPPAPKGRRPRPA